MAYFKWDWQQPPSYRQPAPGRLTLEELLGMQEAFAPPPKPKPVSSIADLPPDQRRRARLDSLWAGMAALGAGATTGDWGRAAQGGVAQLQGMQADALAQANAEQEEAWAAQVQAAQEEAARKKQEQEKRALFGMYKEVAEGESEPFVAKAEAAARAGSMAELENLRQQKPQRATARLKGYDPDAWDTNKRLQEELEAELDRQAKQKEWEEVEKKRLEEEAKLKADAELRARIAQNQAGVLWPPRETPAEAAAKAAAVARAQEKYAKERETVTRIAQLKDGTWAEIHRADETHPRPYAVPIDGQPVSNGKLTVYTKDGVPYAYNSERPELGAVEMPMHGAGDPGAPTIEDLRKPPPAARAAGQAVSTRRGQQGAQDGYGRPPGWCVGGGRPRPAPTHRQCSAVHSGADSCAGEAGCRGGEAGAVRCLPRRMSAANASATGAQT